MEGLKIALVSDWFLPGIGGVEYHIHELATRLTELGHQVVVVTRTGKYPDELLPYNVSRLKGRVNLDGFRVSLATKELRDLIEKERFDVVHSHSIYSPMALTSSLLAKGPNLITNHSLMGKSSMNIIYRAALRLVCRKARAFICVSSAVEKDTRKIFGGHMGTRRVYVVPNGIDPEYWRPARQKESWKKRLDLKGTVITTCARLTSRKRVEVIPRIARILKKKGIRGVKFLIIGDGPRMEMIKALIKVNDVEDIVLMAGTQSREKVREYLWASDIYLSPAIFEAFGIAALEALSCGVPVVANNHGGTAEIVKHKKGGLISRDDAQLIDFLIDLIGNRIAREEMGQNARREVVNNFGWAKVVPRMLGAYNDVLALQNYSSHV